MLCFTFLSFSKQLSESTEDQQNPLDVFPNNCTQRKPSKCNKNKGYHFIQGSSLILGLFWPPVHVEQFIEQNKHLSEQDLTA